MGVSAVLKMLRIGVLASPMVFAQSDPSTWFPRVDGNPWVVGQFTDGAVKSVTKGIVPASGQPSNQAMVFASIRLAGATINGTPYSRGAITTVPNSQQVFSYADRREYKVDFAVANFTVRTIYRFYNNGRFDVRNRFMWTPQPTTARLWIYFDTDMNGAWNDIVEYPRDNPIVGGANWFGPSNETLVSQAAIPHTESGAVERSAYFRVADASSNNPGNQLFAVFYPLNTSSSQNSQIDFIFKNWTWGDENGPSIPPPHSGAWLQSVNAANGSYDQAANGGPDHIIWAGISQSASSTGGSRYYDIAGQLFQKPNGRSLRVNFHTQPERPIPANWATAPVAFGNSGRSANDAFNDLTNGRWQLARYDGMVNGAVGNMTADQLHALMYAERNRTGSVDPNNFREWIVDVLVVNNKWATAPNANGLMFDWHTYSSSTLNNAFAREGCAIFNDGNPNLWDDAWNFMGFAVSHEVGHAMNMHHHWVDNPSATTNLNIMTDKWPFNFAMTWGTFQTLWYQRGPESWVKPGRYGARFSGNRASFFEYFTGNQITP